MGYLIKKNLIVSSKMHYLTVNSLLPIFKTPSANTDNKGHLFVTVFELTAFYTMTLISLNPDTAPVLLIK